MGERVGERDCVTIRRMKKASVPERHGLESDKQDCLKRLGARPEESKELTGNSLLQPPPDL